MEQGPADVRQRHAPEHLPAVGAEADCGHLLLRPDRLHHRDQFADDQRERHERRRQDEARPGEDDLDRQRGEGRPEEPLAAEDQHQRQAGHDRRHRERDVEERHEQGAPGEAEAGHEPGRGDAEDGVDRHGDRGDGEREPDRVPGVGVVGQRRPPGARAERERLDKHARQRHDDQQPDRRHRPGDEDQPDRAGGGGGAMGLGGHRGAAVGRGVTGRCARAAAGGR